MKLYNLQRRFFRRFINRWIPIRVLMCIMAFTCTWTSYVCRLQMPILALPMIAAKPGNVTIEGVCTPESASSGESRLRRSIAESMPITLNPETGMMDLIMHERLRNRERRSADDKIRAVRPPGSPIELFNGKPFDWTFEERGQLIAAYGIGNIPGNLLGGMMSMRWGPRRVVFWTACVAALLSLISPILAQIHWTALGFSRIIVGLTGGVTFPACHTLIAKWAPPDEKARFVWSLLGGTFGTILTYPMISYIAEQWSWELGWYIPALFMMVWLAAWFLIAYDSPEEHPGISDEEKTYILTAQAGTVKTEKPTFKQTPLKAILTSVPFISLVCCHFGNLWLIFFYQNALMIYLTKALGFRLTKGGIVAGLPWAARMSFGFFFSWAGDTIKRKEILSVTALRKTATVFSHLICALFILGVSYVGCAFVLANVFLFLALGFNGAASIANLSNNQDLSPNFAGLLYGIMNTVGTFAGAIIPLLVEEIAGKYGNPIHRWQILFWITSGVTIASMAVFIIGGSGKIQPWNELKPAAGDAEASNQAAKT